MCIVQRYARVLERPAGDRTEPQCPQELQAWQPRCGLALVPVLDIRVLLLDCAFLHQLVAETVDDRANGVDAPEAFVQRRLSHRHSSLLRTSSRLLSVGPHAIPYVRAIGVLRDMPSYDQKACRFFLQAFSRRPIRAKTCQASGSSSSAPARQQPR